MNYYQQLLDLSNIMLTIILINGCVVVKIKWFSLLTHSLYIKRVVLWRESINHNQ